MLQAKHSPPTPLPFVVLTFVGLHANAVTVSEPLTAITRDSESRNNAL
jgi:hypothetical protein